MFTTLVYKWPIQDLSAIASSQTVGAGASLLLNGNLSNASSVNKTTPIGSIDFPGISRTVTITLSTSGSATFLIKGLRNNQYVEETLSINSAVSGTSTNFFDTITEISSSTGTGSLTAKVGTGLKGCTRPFTPNSFLTQTPVATSVHTTLDSGTVSYSVIGSIEKWFNTNSNSSGVITNPTPIYLNKGLVNSVSGEYLGVTSAAASSFITIEDLPLTMLCVNIVGSDATTSLTIRVTAPKLKG